jgi:hypothetical protein
MVAFFGSVGDAIQLLPKRFNTTKTRSRPSNRQLMGITPAARKPDLAEQEARDYAPAAIRLSAMKLL